MLRLDQARHLPGLAGRRRGVARRQQRVTHLAARVRVVVHHEDGRLLPRSPERGRRNRRAAAFFLCGRQGERDPRAPAAAVALGANAAAVRLDQRLADDQPETGPAALARVAAGVPAEQVRQPLRRHALAGVGDRDLDLRSVARGTYPDGGDLRRVARGVGEQVVEHLHDAPRIGQHRGHVGGQVDDDAVPSARARERGPRPFDQAGQVLRRRVPRQQARAEDGRRPAGRRSARPCGRPAPR